MLKALPQRSFSVNLHLSDWYIRALIGSVAQNGLLDLPFCKVLFTELELVAILNLCQPHQVVKIASSRR